jgi:two-component system sensor histidine kinase BaeS
VESARSDELGRLIDDFNRLGNSLQKTESSRRDFMADVSHELRTPLARGKWWRA